MYKFAGPWDHVTSSTLTNLFFKPDGTYEEVCESGYSGAFKDQGAYRTVNWGATGAYQGRGRWKVVGGLGQASSIWWIEMVGRMYAVSKSISGEERSFGGEYFFNGRLYSVKYIYR